MASPWTHRAGERVPRPGPVWGRVRTQPWDPKVARFKVGQETEMWEELRVRA